MGFIRIRYVHFRNIPDGEIDLSAPRVFLVGENGQGKTNILESLYLLCYGSSFRVNRDSAMIRENETEAAVHGTMTLHDGDSLDISVRLGSGAKKISVNGETVADRRDIVRNLPCIVFCHDDIRFVTGSPDQRRWFFNQTLSLYDDTFIDTLRRYSRILRSRNAAIRSEQAALVDAYDPQLAEAGIELTRAREGAAAHFSERFSELYHHISGFDYPLEISYRPSWRGELSIDAVCRELKQSRQSDFRMRTTTRGPHRDRFRFVMNGKEFTETASTGQLRLVSLVLRVAQSVFFSRHSDQKPLLLLDDVMLELDPVRRARFFERLPDYDQALFTFLPDENYAALTGPSTLVYRVAQGRVVKETHHGESR